MSDKTILEQWRAIAYDQQADRNKLQRFWANYFNIEKGIYEQLLSNPDEVVTGTVKELAEKYGQEVLTMVGFLDGINDSLKIPNPIETMDENTKVSLCFDKELLYKNMVDARADWLYELPQWDAIFTPEKRKELYLEQKKSGTVVKARKSDVMILVLAEAARNINIAAVRMRKHPNLEYIIVLGAHVEGTGLQKPFWNVPGGLYSIWKRILRLRLFCPEEKGTENLSQKLRQCAIILWNMELTEND